MFEDISVRKKESKGKGKEMEKEGEGKERERKRDKEMITCPLYDVMTFHKRIFFQTCLFGKSKKLKKKKSEKYF